MDWIASVLSLTVPLWAVLVVLALALWGARRLLRLYVHLSRQSTAAVSSLETLVEAVDQQLRLSVGELARAVRQQSRDQSQAHASLEVAMEGLAEIAREIHARPASNGQDGVR